MVCVAAIAIGLAASSDVSAQSADQMVSLRHPRLVVIKSRRVMYLFDGDTLVRSYPIALGSSPVGQKEKAGDGCTPEGTFAICTRNARSKYTRFLGISYPDVLAMRRGLARGLITLGESRSIQSALASGKAPHWGTALGGGVGIHGRGTQGDWTAGCVAIADRDIEELFQVMRLGDTVEILP